MKLVRACIHGKKIARVTVPEELEPFVEYMFERGFSESTVAVMVGNIMMIMKHGLTEKDLELMSGRRACKLRNAWRHYRNFQKLNKGA